MQTQECSGSGETQFRTLWPKLLPVFCGTYFVSRNGTEMFSRKYCLVKRGLANIRFYLLFCRCPVIVIYSTACKLWVSLRIVLLIVSTHWKTNCTSLSNGCSKQRCPRVMMITGAIVTVVPLKFHRKCLSIPMLFQKSQSIQSSSWQCFWGNLLQEAAAWVWAT